MNKPITLCDRCEKAAICLLNYDGISCRKNRTVEPTNYDRLISKTPEELAVICEDGCPPSLYWNCTKVEIIEGETVKEHCQRCWLNWLKSPADKEEL